MGQATVFSKPVLAAVHEAKIIGIRAGNTMTPIEYRGTVSPELFVTAQRIHAGRRSAVLWVFPAAIVAVVWMQVPQAPVVMLLLVFGIGSLCPLAFSRWTARQWRASYRRSPSLAAPVDAAVTDVGIQYASPSMPGTLPWTSITGIKEHPDMILLYQARNLFTIVPREFFVTCEAWHRAKDAARMYVKRRA